MIHRLSQSITDFLISKEVIEKENAEIYVYGYEALISGIVDFLIIIAVGCFLECAINALIFFCMFVSVRTYSGGYHAETYVKCKMITITILLMVLGISAIGIPFSAVCILTTLFITTVCFQAPIVNKKKPLDDLEKKKYHRISIILSILWGIAAMIVYFFSINISATIVSTGFFITMLMIIAVYGKEACEDEKE